MGLRIAHRLWWMGRGALSEMKTVRLTQLDGSLPNLALMKLAHFHKNCGDTVVLERSARPHDDELQYDIVYGSSIFKFSSGKLARFQKFFPDAIVGGTGTDSKGLVEDIIGPYDLIDYSLYPNFTASMGFTQRGCRLACGFCVVPWKEGKPSVAQTVSAIWRGPGHPKNLHLLDNDFFAIKGWWQERMAEIRDGNFRVCFSQGINVRAVTEEVATELATIEYRDDSFSRRRLYTAWDNLGHESVFFRGVDRLEAAGVPARHLMAYMLIGYSPDETWEQIHYRFQRMVTRGIRPYPMVFDCRETDRSRYLALKQFQRWAVTGLYRAVPFSDYDASKRVTRQPSKLTRQVPSLTL